MSQGKLYPPLSNIREVSIRIAVKVVEYVYAHGVAFHYPEPLHKEQFIRSKIWNIEYDSFCLIFMIGQNLQQNRPNSSEVTVPKQGDHEQS
ncbi:NAD-dependent malic enzyme, mitochondrial-like [Acipenser oxyrinchus oxyrinchus]|uniref:NAD-dependent malic enzyme, mitochondrial-like n=1 Tax=Acipenser oxyrinchus oxyrinchus TaxID=40147 RepID=A0AAD8FNU9_ACIOX|nr:NAD-dependent malic enzyme, mitochondrial-like [Acipenser oxyrinchus oxyrinchus]